MEQEKNFKFDLASFKKSLDEMVASNANDARNVSRYYERFIHRTYTLEDVERIIQSGSLSEQQKLSRTFFYKDGFYKRILIYYATLLKFMGVLIPNPTFNKNLSDSYIQKRYNAALDFIENSSIQTLFTNCSLRVLIDGYYYGIVQTFGKESFTLMDLPAQYCRSIVKDLKGNDLVEFNVAYFDSFMDQDIKRATLEAYPKIIRQYYRKWAAGKVESSWVLLPIELAVCFNLFEGLPMFLSVIPATIQYDDTVDTERERDLDEIRKIIVQKIPHLQDGGLLFEPEEAEVIHKGTVGMLKQNKNVSVLTTYADVDAIVSKTTSEAVSNNLEKMVQNIYNEGGVSNQVFAATGNLSVEISIKNDVAFIMHLANKYSVFLSNLLNLVFGNTNINFKYEFLPITYYNESTFITDSFKLAQSGYSFILPALALGVTQRDLGNLKDLENDVMKLGEKLKPLQSAYTQSANSVGAPEKSSDEKSEKTIANEVSLDNQGGVNEQ